ncbi:hypothetical protein Fmac_003832 [Flemingia macrophylla]|uniref:Galactose oxidase n=1 Tax=Flemingia macrophylla TaxID=520843 RepID=A0ABD1N384_9FABA
MGLNPKQLFVERFGIQKYLVWRSEAKHKKKNKHKKHNNDHKEDPKPIPVLSTSSEFQDPFVLPKLPITPEQFITLPLTPTDKNDQPYGGEIILGVEPKGKGDFKVDSLGHWDLISQNMGVSAMHINLLPTNKIIAFDALIYRVSRIKLPEGAPCIPYRDDATQQDKLDCYAHAVEYDIETNQVRPLQINAGDPWCSSGGVAPDGTFVGTGGFFTGARSVRYLGPDCQDCQWREYNDVLAADRWYATQQILPNGEFFLIGGRKSFNYEFVPKEGQRQGGKPYFFPFLYETSDLDENNLYPFVHLSTDGNLFIFANNRSVLLNPTSHKIVRTLPVLPGGARNYPASGMSALLPIDLNLPAIKAEVIVCGGNLPGAFRLADTAKIFLPALQDCNRITITDSFPKWDSELMPSRRTMGDLLNLPSGELLFINGATMGTSAWWDADEPNYTPVLYKSNEPKGARFTVLKESQIARMYHSTSAVLPSGKVWVSGSNTHDTYRDVDKFPTETRVEAFSPPYLDVNFDMYRPQINEETLDKELTYDGFFETRFSIQDRSAALTKSDIKVSILSPPFTTHGFSMGQRLLFLKVDELVAETEGTYRVRFEAPPSGEIAPPGYYLLFVVHRGLPGKGMWVHIQ